MSTVTYQIQHWPHEDTGSGDCYCVMECVTLHVITGDEYSEFCIASFGSNDEALEFIKSLH